jgi:hypothetical protein
MRCGRVAFSGLPGLFKRSLPNTLVSFSSDKGRAMFRAALDSGHCEGFFALCEQFHTQSEPSFCGPGTLSMVLNALALDPRRIWKHPWRWFSEDVLSCLSHDEVRRNGMALRQFALIARCNGANASVHFADECTEEAFRRRVVHVSTTRHSHMVISFSRRALCQTGDGHFSPVGAYDPASDSVLVLDVARFKYPPWWASLSEVWKAMTAIDASTSRSRGYIILSPNDHEAASAIKVPYGRETWKLFRRALSCEYEDENVVTVLNSAICSSGADLSMSDDPRSKLLVNSLQETTAYRLAHQRHCDRAASIAIYILASPLHLFSSCNKSRGYSVLKCRADVVNEDLRKELDLLQRQMELLDEFCDCPDE